jgi:hypothetical protein
LTDSYVDAEKGFSLVTGIVSSLLVKDCVDGNSSLTSLSVTNNQLTLATTNWH